MLAYRDSMTGLRNTTSYKEWIVDFNKKIKNEDIAFGVIVFDINFLKNANDTYGHNIGNNLIITASKMVSDTFKRSPVFRVGGDEFVVILQNRDLEEYEKLIEKLEADCAGAYITTDTDEKLPISIAKGFSTYDPATDTKFADVFNRADNEMYKNKRLMKEANN